MPTFFTLRAGALSLGLLVFALDWLTKYWIKHSEWLHYHPVIPGFFTIHYVQNRGIAFGLFHSIESDWKPLLLSVFAFFGLFIVLYYIWKTPEKRWLPFVSLGMLLGGILGNLTDRIWNGSVVDFLELHWGEVYSWPTFNIADSAITVGVFLLIYETFFSK
ncbi:MAG: signal peptidase II [Acidobacteria bacterium]|nr:signal peptidase II [Acidobacteriota bacterium]